MPPPLPFLAVPGAPGNYCAGRVTMLTGPPGDSKLRVDCHKSCPWLWAGAGASRGVRHMNVFRLAGDLIHLLSIVTLLLKIQATKSCRGALCSEVSCNSMDALEDAASLSCSSADAVPLLHRHLTEDTGALRGGFHYPLSRPVLRIRLFVRPLAIAAHATFHKR